MKPMCDFCSIKLWFGPKFKCLICYISVLSCSAQRYTFFDQNW